MNKQATSQQLILLAAFIYCSSQFSLLGAGRDARSKVFLTAIAWFFFAFGFLFT